MPRIPTLTPRDRREKAVIEVWRTGGLQWSTIAVYLGWVRRWRTHCRTRRIDELLHLTLAGVTTYTSTLIGPRKRRLVGRACKAVAANSLHGWSCALQKLGVTVPNWRPSPSVPRLPALLEAYAEHRRAHRSVAPGTVRHDVEVASKFLTSLRARRRSISTLRIADIDAFVDSALDRFSPATVADRCSSLRAFLRFLRSTGRLRRDLADIVVGPRVRVGSRPPRALPWADVRRILRAIPRRRLSDVRDYAMPVEIKIVVA